MWAAHMVSSQLTRILLSHSTEYSRLNWEGALKMKKNMAGHGYYEC